MSRSVIITTPFPTPEEIAADLGISQSRLRALRDIVEGNAKRNGRKPRNGSIFSARKKSGRSRAKR